MKNILALSIFLSSIPVVWAEDLPLPFPTTEAEIVKALTPRSKTRGIAGIVNDNPRVGATIHFAYDSAAILPDSYALLREYANAFKGDLAGAAIEIAGHADSWGDTLYNLALSERRAQAVKYFLVNTYQVPANQLFTKAYGESQPIAANETAQGRQLNRRVEFARK